MFLYQSLLISQILLSVQVLSILPRKQNKEVKLKFVMQCNYTFRNEPKMVIKFSENALGGLGEQFLRLRLEKFLISEILFKCLCISFKKKLPF